MIVIVRKNQKPSNKIFGGSAFLVTFHKPLKHCIFLLTCYGHFRVDQKICGKYTNI